MVLSAASAGASAGAADYSALPTAEQIASAMPRDLVIDHRGLGYLRGIDGSLTPYGHSVAAERRPVDPRARGGVPGPPGGGGGDIVTHAHWTLGGDVQDAAGRILFTFDGSNWYVCSGTVVTDGDIPGRSIVLTAAHCIFDDVAKAFAATAIFIPSQDDGGSDRTDWDCRNDTHGCWLLDHGVVDINWTTRTFPNNIAWDYGYYVVSDAGAHTHSNYPWVNWQVEALDDPDRTPLSQQFSSPNIGNKTHALGYSYSGGYDPNFMYCAEDMSTEGADNYWLGKCDLTGGSSGGPWVQPMDELSGSGPVISVNSWGYTFQSGMAGPKLHDNSASVLFEYAKTSTMGPVSNGHIVSLGASENVRPTAAFTSSCTDLDCSFTDTSGDPDGSIVSWSWDFGDGSLSSTAMDPNHSYSSGGTYAVTLTVTDNEGATDSSSDNVTVTDPNGGVTYSTSSTSQGRTWTAIVTANGPFSGSFDGGDPCSGVTSCEWSGIRKNIGSVTFLASDGTILTIYKP